jgi:phosphoglycolate phosphatase-like HAD superfamily hydrolase
MNNYLPIQTECGEALVLAGLERDFGATDGIIFDFDGVLVDVSRSVDVVHTRTADAYFSSLGWRNTANMVSRPDIVMFKLAGGFNDDWDSSVCWQLLYLFKSLKYGITDGAELYSAHPSFAEFTTELRERGGGPASAEAAIRERCTPDEWADLHSRWDKHRLLTIFKETFAGDLTPDVYGYTPAHPLPAGLMRQDRPILRREFILEGLFRGIATGRLRGEAEVGIRLQGWSDLFPPRVTITQDDGFTKPDPRILELAVERTGMKRPIYIGDTPDDLLTARRYAALGGSMLACCVLTGLDGDGKARFLADEPDMIADNVNAALLAIKSLISS